MTLKTSHNSSSQIIDALGSTQFFDRLAEVIDNIAPYAGMVVFLYDDKNAPMLLGSYKLACDYADGLENFVKYTYVINPVYRAFLGDIEADTYLIADLVPQDNASKIARSGLKIRIDATEAIGYRTPGWPKNMTEVLGLVWLPDNKMIELNFLIKPDAGKIKKCQQGLEEIYPVLASAILKHFEILPKAFDIITANPSQENRFQDFGRGVLTNREQDIVKMILTGHSSNSIVLNLNISLPTVKSHRRNVYQKFQISSQAELFNLFVRHLMDNAA